MKIAKGATLKHAYLYRDGHGVAVFSQYHKPSKKDVEWAEVFETFIESGSLAFHPGGEYGTEKPAMNGRVILRGSLPLLVSKAREVRVWRDNSSIKTREMGLKIQTLSIELRDRTSFSLTNIEHVMSEDFEYQERCFDGSPIESCTFAETTKAAKETGRWHGYDVGKIHRTSPETSPVPETVTS